MTTLPNPNAVDSLTSMAPSVTLSTERTSSRGTPAPSPAGAPAPSSL